MVQFTCKAGAANPKVERYTLYQNGTVIANMRSSGVSTLWLNTSSIFIYKCVADNSVGNGTSNGITVTVEGPFSVTGVNPKTVVKEGDNVVLSCNATGKPAPKVVWVDTRNEEVNSGATWILPQINKAQNGTYSCVASNACGRDNKTTAIVVEYIERKVTGDQYMTVNSGDSATLTCLVDGYPEPNITWYKGNDIVENSPLNGKALVFNPSKKADSGCYTCIASNKAGKVNVTRCLTVEEESSTSPSKEVTLRITLTITNAECNEAGIVERIRVEVKNVLARFGLENVQVTIRCGSVIVDLILQFSQTVSENDVINTLKTAAREDQFGDFKVDPDSIKATSDDSEGSDCEESFLKDTSCSIKLEVAIGISVAAVVLIAIITAAVGYWIHRKKRKRRKDARMLYQNQVARDPGNEEQRLKGDDPYAQVNNGYVFVDKSKKKKKNEKVDMSKKTKKKPRPGEDMLYADLGDFSGASQMPTVATSLTAQPQLPPIKRPEPYEGMQYADITQFLNGATLPIDDKQGGEQGTELKEKDEKTDGAGGENAPKETPT